MPCISCLSLLWLLISSHHSACCPPCPPAPRAQEALDSFRFPDAAEMRHELDRQTGPAFRRLNDAVVQLLDDFSMVTFTPLDISEEESIEDLLMQIDMAIQVGGGSVREHAGPGGSGGMRRPNACFTAYSSAARCSPALTCPAPTCLAACLACAAVWRGSGGEDAGDGRHG